MNLPNKPGLLRRLAYGEYIRRIHFNTSRLLVLQGRNIYMEPETYEELSELENVEKGLSLEDLLVNTKIEMQNLLFFCAICQDIQAEILAETKISVSRLINDLIIEHAVFLEELLYLQSMSGKERYETLIKGEPQVLQRVSLTDLASFLGMSRETLSRIRSNQ